MSSNWNLPVRVQARIDEPDAELRQFVELDFVAVVLAHVVEARKFDHQAVDDAFAVVVKTRRAGMDEIREPAVVFRGEHRAHLMKHSQLFVEHRHFDVARENFVELLARDLGQEISVEDRNAFIHGALDAGEFRFGIRPVLAGIFGGEFYVRGEIGEGRIDHVGDHDEIDGFVRIVYADACRQMIFRHGKFLVGHPAGDFHDLVNVRVDVAGIFDYRAEAIENGTADWFGPAQRSIGFHASEINTGGSCASSVPEGIPSGSCQHYGTSKSLQKPPASTGAQGHQKMNLAPAWNANGVLPGAIWLTTRKPSRRLRGRQSGGRERTAIPPELPAAACRAVRVHSPRWRWYRDSNTCCRGWSG